jgi:hypothetical protein
MMRSTIFAAVLALAACSGGDAGESAGPADLAACAASANATWRSFTIEATTEGADCEAAQARIVIRRGEEEAWNETYPASRVMALAGAVDAEDMERRLSEWIDPPAAGRDSTGDLPVWPAGAAGPMSGEFPFYVEEGLDRAAYEAVRGRDAPMFCYIQGMESAACLALEDGRLAKIGVQSFPG